MNQKTTDKLAKHWRTTPRTIQRWAAEDAPLSDKRLMFAWLSGRKNLPPQTAELLREKRNLAVKAPGAPMGETGPGHALARLEQAEMQAYRSLTTALEAGDLGGIRFARTNWLAIGESLRKFHSQVEQTDRVGGEAIARVTAENYLRGVSYWLNTAFRDMAAALQELYRNGTLPDSQQVFEMLSRIYLQSLASALGYQCQTQISKWVYAAMTSTSPFKAPAACVEADKLIYEKIVAALKECAETPSEPEQQS